MSSRDRSLKTLITTMPIVEISAYFSIDRLLPELKWVADAAVNATNVDKVQAIQTDLERFVSNDSISAPLILTFAVMGKPNFKGSSNLTSSLRYDSSDTYIVGNVLGAVAICKILGLKTFLFSSRLSVKDANSKSELRQRLAMESVEIRVIFDDQRGLNSADVIELFKQSRTFDSSMSLPHIADSQGVISDKSYPLSPFIKELITRSDMELYGGVNFDAKHVKVSESYIATEYVLFKLIVGAVAGVGTQEYSKMSKDIMLNSGERISSVLSSGYIDYVVAFMKGWLEPLRGAFVDNRSGYHLSPQVWQALGLTIHQLVSGGASIEKLNIAGTVLGQLNYSKNAKHWSNCSVMELDSKGRIYKNAASSTRQFRVGLFEYFLYCAL
ncbi:hypothetical protein [Vibrio brasiliensis]|uniref:hypothetical protein n=1 Tax=Vibrio brasiliensis TaxID=170652 RepID=UPI001EFE723E|nr:hypothetical protein [Vibrio brasiliensis]MCG9727876.1 hypothetical protein [Vibrio brasiliensis]